MIDLGKWVSEEYRVSDIDPTDAVTKPKSETEPEREIE
jgi:endogenous inhibitor of DNA gyrase (YacG/DUF329 family)